MSRSSSSLTDSSSASACASNCRTRSCARASVPPCRRSDRWRLRTPTSSAPEGSSVESATIPRHRRRRPSSGSIDSVSALSASLAKTGAVPSRAVPPTAVRSRTPRPEHILQRARSATSTGVDWTSAGTDGASATNVVCCSAQPPPVPARRSQVPERAGEEDRPDPPHCSRPWPALWLASS